MQSKLKFVKFLIIATIFFAAGLSGVKNVSAVAISPPINLRITAVSATEISLAWDAPVDLDINSLFYYKVYRDGVYIGTSLDTSNSANYYNDPNHAGFYLADPTKSSYRDIGLLSNTTYNYSVSVYVIEDIFNNIKPESQLSNAVTATTPSSSALSRLIYPNNFQYIGAFKFPNNGVFSYGGYIAYYPNGDPQGANDGYSGSLFAMSSRTNNSVAEISIPSPINSTNINNLNTAGFLQPLSDVTGGLKDQIGSKWSNGYYIRIGYLPKQGQQSADKLYWNIYDFYPAASSQNVDWPTMGWSELDLSNPQAQGVWHIGPYGTQTNDYIEYNSMSSANYIFEIPKNWADQYVSGKYLASGRAIGPRRGVPGASKGPAIFAVGPYNDGNPPAVNSELSAKKLLTYTNTGDLPNWDADDDWRAGSWITVGNRSAIMFIGNKGLGERWYGNGRLGDQSSSKGNHADPYETQFMFYDPADLAAVANGQKAYNQVMPYLVMRPTDFLPGDPKGIAYDRTNGVLYVSYNQSGNAIVHTYKLNDASYVAQCSDSIDNDGDGFCDVVGAICADGSIAGDPGCSSLTDDDEVDITPSITYNLNNFTNLISDWLKTTTSSADVNNDNIVNTRDLGIMMSNWE